MIVVADTLPICYLSLISAARQNWVDFPEAIARLHQTTFRASSKLIQSLLQQYQQKY